MGIKGSDKFVAKDVKIPVNSTVYPPPEIKWEGSKLFHLGKSNKDDLMPVNIDSDEIVRAVTFGSMGQFIYTSEHGYLFDVCLYQNESRDVYIFGIRTRELPEKTARKK